MLGYTGILSFGHAMFFGVGAYATGILLKHAGWSLGPAVLARDRRGSRAQRSSSASSRCGCAASTSPWPRWPSRRMFFILVQATDFRDITGAEDGLHGIPVPAWLNPTERAPDLLLRRAGLLRGDVSDRAARGRFAARPRDGGDPRKRAAGADDRLQHLRLQAAGCHAGRRHGGAGRPDERALESERHAGGASASRRRSTRC